MELTEKKQPVIKLTEKKEETLYKFVGVGNFSRVLMKSYMDEVTNASGRVMRSNKVSAKKAVFENGQFQTTDLGVVQLMLHDRLWGKDFTWHPSMEKIVAEMEGIKMNKKAGDKIAKTNIDRQARKKESIKKRIQRGKVPEDDK